MANLNTNHLNITFKLPAREDNDNRRLFTFNVIRNDERNGKWLAAVIAADVDNRPETIGASSWSNAAPAKRWCENIVGRKIDWVSSDDGKFATASVELDYEHAPLMENVSIPESEGTAYQENVIEDAEIVEE